MKLTSLIVFGYFSMFFFVLTLKSVERRKTNVLLFAVRLSCLATCSPYLLHCCLVHS